MKVRATGHQSGTVLESRKRKCRSSSVTGKAGLSSSIPVEFMGTPRHRAVMAFVPARALLGGTSGSPRTTEVADFWLSNYGRWLWAGPSTHERVHSEPEQNDEHFDEAGACHRPWFGSAPARAGKRASYARGAAGSTRRRVRPLAGRRRREARWPGALRYRRDRSGLRSRTGARTSSTLRCGRTRRRRLDRGGFFLSLLHEAHDLHGLAQLLGLLVRTVCCREGFEDVGHSHRARGNRTSHRQMFRADSRHRPSSRDAPPHIRAPRRRFLRKGNASSMRIVSTMWPLMIMRSSSVRVPRATHWFSALRR